MFPFHVLKMNKNHSYSLKKHRAPRVLNRGAVCSYRYAACAEALLKEGIWLPFASPGDHSNRIILVISEGSDGGAPSKQHKGL